MNKLKIAEFFKKEYDGPKVKIIVMSLIGTLALAAVVAVINKAAEVAFNKTAQVEMNLFFIYATICAIAILCKLYTLTQTTIMAEEVVQKVRVRLIDKLRKTELEFIERNEKGYLYSRIASDTDYISQYATDVINVFEAVFTGIFVYLYIAILSLSGIIFSIMFVIILGSIFFMNYKKMNESLNLASSKESKLYTALDDTIYGFKEIKINLKKNDALFSDIEDVAKETETIKVAVAKQNSENIVMAFLFYEGLLGLIVFVVPIFSSAHTLVITKIVSALIYIFSFLPTLSRGVPVILGMNVAASNLEQLETLIDDELKRENNQTGTIKTLENVENKQSGEQIGSPLVSPLELPIEFNEIKMNSVKFIYTDKFGERSFSVGPIDLTIKKGEVLFIIGGNGSGKSTLLKLLTGLYFPSQGFINLDDRIVNRQNRQSYRELFSTIFTDFHLFKKLYGIESVDENNVKELLKAMELHKKTDFVDGKFTYLDLSTGQKKRIAYITSVLENKSVYVFDEWAADQDPEFRSHFYNRFLNDLKAMKKTIIAVTHDDRYFDKADRIIKMDEGNVVSL